MVHNQVRLLWGMLFYVVYNNNYFFASIAFLDQMGVIDYQGLEQSLRDSYNTLYFSNRVSYGT